MISLTLSRGCFRFLDNAQTYNLKVGGGEIRARENRLWKKFLEYKIQLLFEQIFVLLSFKMFSKIEKLNNFKTLKVFHFKF